ncbi:hypothetical protein OKW28_003128 [Paraburkholderia sp. 40]
MQMSALADGESIDEGAVWPPHYDSCRRLAHNLKRREVGKRASAPHLATDQRPACVDCRNFATSAAPTAGAPLFQPARTKLSTSAIC